jgi:hypothetical protein
MFSTLWHCLVSMQYHLSLSNRCSDTGVTSLYEKIFFPTFVGK